MVERNLAKVEVESSRLFSRSKLKGQHFIMLSFFIGVFGQRCWALGNMVRSRQVEHGAVTKRLCTGLQIRVGRFDSGPRLHRFDD